MAGRKSSNNPNSIAVPGPGQYNPNLTASKENLGGVKIGTA
jgi:hypothetical protein